MPRFFFHIYDEMIVSDDDGIELPDERAARMVALAGARDMICAQVRHGRLNLHHRIEVEDEDGAMVLTLSFAEAVDVEPPYIPRGWEQNEARP